MFAALGMSDRHPVRVITEFHGPEYDAPADRAVAPVKSCVICSTPRSGSEMLYTGLAGTGVLGTALEYFNPSTRLEMSERWGCGPDLASYVETLHARRT